MKKFGALIFVILLSVVSGCSISADLPIESANPPSDLIVTSSDPSVALSESTEPDYWSLVSFQSSTSAPKNSLVRNSFEIEDSLYGSDVMGALKTTKIYESYEAGENVKLEFSYYMSGNLMGNHTVQGIVTSKTDNSMTISATYSVGQSSDVNIQAVYNAVY